MYVLCVYLSHSHQGQLFSRRSSSSSSSSGSTDIEQRLSKLLSLVVKGDKHGTGRHISTHSLTSPLSPEAAAAVLLEIGELAQEHGYTQITAECLRDLSVEHLHAPDHLTQRQLLSAQQMVGDNDAMVYTKSSVEVYMYIHYTFNESWSVYKLPHNVHVGTSPGSETV